MLTKIKKYAIIRVQGYDKFISRKTYYERVFLHMIYGYSRVSTNKQSHARQIQAIQKAYPDCVLIFKDTCTGRTQNRDSWNKLKKRLKEGDTIVFEDVCRMSRNAEEGFEEYKELFSQGIELVFLHHPHVNTAKYRELLKENAENPVGKKFEELRNLKTGDEATDTMLSGIFGSLQTFIETINMQNVEKDIIQAFDEAEQEIAYLSQRTKDGMKAHKASKKITEKKTGMQYRTEKILKRMIDVLTYSRYFHISEKNIHDDAGTARQAETSVRTVIRIRERIMEEKGNMSAEEYLYQLKTELKELKAKQRKKE